MIALGEPTVIGLLTLVGVIMTGSFTPYLLKRLDRKNTSQHRDGYEQRETQTAILKEIQAVQLTHTKDIHEIKNDILAVKIARLQDKKEFVDLLEREEDGHRN